MSGRPPPQPPPARAIVLGQQFATFTEFKAAIAEWSARDNFDIRYKKSDSTINIVVCWIPECAFRVRAIRKVKLGCVEVTVMDATHSACIGIYSSPCKGEMFHLQADWSLCAEMP